MPVLKFIDNNYSFIFIVPIYVLRSLYAYF